MRLETLGSGAIAKAVSALVLFCFEMQILAPYTAMADQVDDAALSAKEFAADISPTKDTFPDVGAPTISVTGKNDKGEDVSISLDVNTTLTGESGNPDTATMEGAYGDDASVLSVGNAANSALRSADSPEGQAYKLLVNSANRSHPDITNDPIWNGTQDVLENADVVTTFSDCSSEVTYTQTSTETITDTEIRECERSVAATSSCVVKHDIEPKKAFYGITTDGTAGSVTATTIEGLSFGAVGASMSVTDLLGSNGPDPCPDSQATFSFEIGNPDDIMMVAVNNVKVDHAPSGWIRVLVGDEEVYRSDRDDIGLQYYPEVIAYLTYIQPSFQAPNVWDDYCPDPSPQAGVTGVFNYVGQTGMYAPVPCACQEDGGSYLCTYYPYWYGQYGFDGENWNWTYWETSSGASEPFQLSHSYDPRFKGWGGYMYWDMDCPTDDTLTASHRCSCTWAFDSTNQTISRYCDYVGGDRDGDPVQVTTFNEHLNLDRVTPRTGGKLNREYLTQLFKNGANTVTIERHGGACTAHIDMGITYKGAQEGGDESWYTDECIAELNTINDLLAQGACTGSLECTNMAPVNIINGKRTTNVNGITVYETQLADPPIAGVDKFCRQVKFNGECNKVPITPPECFTASDGSEVCVDSQELGENECETLENDPNCGIEKSECITYNEQGQCSQWSDSYRCVTATNDVQNYDVKETITCGGPIRCLGEECVDTAESKSESFGKVASTMQSLNDMKKYGECNTFGCTIFKGKRYSCLNMGSAKCCIEPNKSGASLQSYLAAYLVMVNTDDMIMSLDSSSMVRGAWSAVRQPVVNAWDTVSGMWQSAVENITGETATDAVMEQSVSAFKEKILQASYDFVVNTFGEDVAGSVFATSGGVATGLNPGVTTLMSSVMAAYTAYQAIKLAAALLNKCKTEDSELAAKRKLKLCHKVERTCVKRVKIGNTCIKRRHSYCCYDSPLGRIINEQAKLQGAVPDWTANDTCGGLSLTDFERIDWDQVDLGEWVDMLKSNNLYPTPENMTLESLTGEGGAFDLGDSHDRDNAYEREAKRLGPADSLHQVHKEAETQLWGSTIPAPIPP